uniref:Retrotransposon protein, putative, unclassified n=1 Tax=Oryza sativa subsp. japonica TaxID=39947 RepID=Q2QUZ2_ORYSJ|nr:retrotransposon protein, putative, unclassified [Oryza sativa Japonica Group]
MTSTPAAARQCMLAGERRRDDANGGHQRVEGDAVNSPMTKTTAKSNGWRRRRGRSGDGLRVDGDGGAPAVFGGGGAVDEDGDATATTMATSPSDGDDWSDGEARLERRQRRRRLGLRGGGARRDGGLRQRN